jgi:hypothetical protein
MSNGLKPNRNASQSDGDRSVRLARFFLWTGSALFLGNMEDASAHAHHALQVAVGLNGAFVLETPSETIECRSVVIAPDQVHRFRGGGGEQAIIVLDTESTVAQNIQVAMSKGAGVREFDIALVQPSLEQLGLY